MGEEKLKMMMKNMKIKSLKTIAYAGVMQVMAVGCATDGVEFSDFTYQGMDEVWNVEIDSAHQYLNPIVGGYYPDPALCRKGDDYFLVNSSFSYYPGVPIFHSKDLVNWTPLGHVLNRPSQLKLDGIRLSGGIYAPDIQYNPQNDTFYMITTCVDGIGNFYVKTKDPFAGHWSDPIVVPTVHGIDPSFFFDEDGKAYIVHNDAPEGNPQWQGHRAIRIHEFDIANDSVLNSTKIIIDGGVDRSKHPIWIEGPHLYKVSGKYYLMAAEGGTSIDHSEVIFVSDSPMGEYKPCAINPILTQRDLPADRLHPVTNSGHADLIDTPEGNWYAVFLACRPYKNNVFNTGRETFMLPVTWNDEQPVILEQGKSIPYVVNKASLTPKGAALSGNFSETIRFSEPLDYRWSLVRTPDEKWWKAEDGHLYIQPRPVALSEAAHPAFIGRRQQHTSFEVSVKMRNFVPQSENDMAGLACYMDEQHYFLLGLTQVEGENRFVVECNYKQRTVLGSVTAEATDDVLFKIKGEGEDYSFYVSTDGGQQWITLCEKADGSIISTAHAGGFTGVMLGMYVSNRHNER